MKNPNKALVFIFFVVLIDAIGFGIILPVMPDLIEKLTGEGTSEASVYGAWLTFAYAFMQFLFSPILGGLSDRFGRRPILLSALLGLGLDFLLHAWAPTIFWLFVGRIIAGIMGASFTTAMAYIADVSDPKKRAQNFGLVGAAFGLGFVIGPALGSTAIAWGLRAPFYLAAGLSLVNFLYGMFFVPESLAPENRRPFDWNRANPVGTLLQLKKYPAVAGLIASLTLIYLAAHAVQSTWAFYTKYKFDWDVAMIGYSLTFVGFLVLIVQGGLIRIVIPRIGQKRSIMTGLILYTVGMASFGFASEGWMMYAFLIPYSLGGLAGPAIQGYMSNSVPDDGQGELQGGFTSLVAITAFIGPILMNNLFAWFTRDEAPVKVAGAPYFLGGILLIISIGLTYRTLRRNSRSSVSSSASR
ncbi:MAG: TCR/Tet family MFS transporter [Leptolyngbya sp. SIO3F4]|nr:TCR/Tet family MFS transporter [Leptolyngbya sp. SIO3F4]